MHTRYSRVHLAAGDTRTLRRWGEDKGQRLTFLLCRCDWSKWRIHLEMKMEEMGPKMCVFHNHLCIYLFTLCLLLLLCLFPPSTIIFYIPSDPSPILVWPWGHSWVQGRPSGAEFELWPPVSSGSKHTRTFINATRAPLCIIVVILILSTVAWAATK